MNAEARKQKCKEAQSGVYPTNQRRSTMNAEARKQKCREAQARWEQKHGDWGVAFRRLNDLGEQFNQAHNKVADLNVELAEAKRDLDRHNTWTTQSKLASVQARLATAEGARDGARAAKDRAEAETAALKTEADKAESSCNEYCN
ncbi:MAG: hypothetical protein ABSF50_11250 [Burkholderiaceae bacterium]